MQTITFYFDPCCPFCWITSRWLLEVAKERQIDITWRPFSLAMKNDELGPDVDQEGRAKSHLSAHRVLRVIAAATRQGASVVDLYTAFGRALHTEGRDLDDALIAEVLDQAGLPADLAGAADDASWDDVLRSELDSALDVVGQDTGVPAIIFDAADGKQLGYFGPVLNTMPGHDESLAIWDGLSAMATAESFYELKRSRPSGGPDTASTKGL